MTKFLHISLKFYLEIIDFFDDTGSVILFMAFV